MHTYPIKIQLAFLQALKEEQKFLDWLFNNNYKELAALAYALNGSEDATHWLIENKYPHFAAFSEAFYEDNKAFKWLKEHNYHELTIVVVASRGDWQAKQWLRSNYKVLAMIADHLEEMHKQIKKEDKSLIKNIINFGNPFKNYLK